LWLPSQRKSECLWRPPKARFRSEIEDKDVDAGAILEWNTPASIEGRVFVTGLSTTPVFTNYTLSLASAEPVADSVRITPGPNGLSTFRN
jgi:hypothetical protein